MGDKDSGKQLKVDIAGIKFKNPVIAASGTFGFGREFEQFIDLNMLGGICTKGITLEPRQGNNPPRIAETPAGILNSVGLQNPGVKYFINNELPFLKKFDTKIIANVAGSTIEEYCEICEMLDDTSIDAIELNLSCPNVKAGCAAFGSSAKGLYEITSIVRQKTCKPLIVKLTPNFGNIPALAKAAEDSGADAVSLINTILGMAIDIESGRPILANNFGGLSGPAVKPVAVRMVYEAYQAVNIPVIGMGGICRGEDAVEFMLAGATAVMVGTANLVNPCACINIVKGIEEYLMKKNIGSVYDIIGSVKLHSF